MPGLGAGAGRAATIFRIVLPVLFLWQFVAAAPAFAGPVVKRLNSDRAAEDLEQLAPDPRLDAVAWGIAAEVTRAGSADLVEIDGGVVGARLKEEGYFHRLLVVAYVVGAEEEQLATEWRALDSASWQRMLQAELRDVALARGETADGPFYLLLGAVSQNDAKAQEAEGLADLATVRRRVLELTNEYRRAADILELKPDEEVDRVAQDYANDMLYRGFYAHESPEGHTVMDRLKAHRVFVRRSGENLAEGPPTPEAAVKSWYDSPAHRRNLLHESFRRMGSGVAAGKGPDGTYRILWVQVFTAGRRPVL